MMVFLQIVITAMIVTTRSESSGKVTPAPHVRITIRGIIFKTIPLCVLRRLVGVDVARNTGSNGEAS